MPPAWIRPRTVKVSKRNPRGRTFQVLYKRGGRNFPVETAGTFKTEREAKIRRDLVGGWLAAGLNPKAELAKALVEPPAKLSLGEWALRYQGSRVDVAEETTKNLRSHIKKIEASPLAVLPAETITVADLADLVAEWAVVLAPSSLSRYMATLRLVFDFANIDPNPARNPRLKLPTIQHAETTPPTADEFVAMLDAMPHRYWLPLIVLEQTGMRVGEASTLTWGDVDEHGHRFRLRSASTKTRRARWVQVPGWLMEVIAATVPREDRTEARRVFLNFNSDVAKNAMARACRSAGISLYSPHDLRHRRLSLWHGQGVPARELADRAGHSKPSMTLDVYSHTMPADELTEVTLRELLGVAGV